MDQWYLPLSFGTWLKQQRKKTGITRDALADKVACSSITLQKIESGERRPSRQIALSLAEVFQIRADEHEAFVTFARTLTPRDQTSLSPVTPATLSRSSDSDHYLPAETGEEEQVHSPWRAAHLSKSNLPLALTALIGREQEQEEICGKLRQPKVRLLTLTGSPGTGKTRLSIEAASALMGDFEDGVYLVELAPLTDPAMVIPSIARALGLRETSAQSVEDSLLGYIRDKRILLVLDNFEHLLDAGPAVVKLIEASPWVKVLITSREALHVRGERQYPLPPLNLPVLSAKGKRVSPTFEELACNPAVQLFTERAQSVDAGFILTEENVLEVAEICVNLNGLPLAIELAAGRVSLFPPRTLLLKLDQQLKVLTGGSRDLPPRQRTLRGAIEWSYDLLDEGGRELLRRMAVFAGGGTLHGLEAVCNSSASGTNGEGVRELELDIVDGVDMLVASNLLQREEGFDGEPRFCMLEAIQEYAREKLEESEEEDALQREHVIYFMNLAEEAEPHFSGNEQEEWLDRLQDEYDNLMAALVWTREQAHRGDNEAAEMGLRTVGAIYRFWQMRSLLTEGREQLERSLSVPEQVLQACSSTYRAKALTRASYLATRQGDYSSARALSERAIALSREAGDKQSMIFSLNNLGAVTYEQGDYIGAYNSFCESLELSREIEDEGSISSSLSNLGVLAYERGDYAQAQALYKESLAVRREIGDKWGISMSLSNLGLVVYEEGDYNYAHTLHEESLALRREIGDKWGTILSLNNLGFATSTQGDYRGAYALHREGLALSREIGDKKGIAACLVGLAGVAVGMGQVERGTRLLGAVHWLLEKMGAVLHRDDRLPYERASCSARSALGEERFQRVVHEGRGMSLEAAAAYALESDNCQP